MPRRGIDQEAKKLFIETLAQIVEEEKIEQFLSDLFSSSEVKDHSRRLLAAKFLTEGKTYEEINLVMGMSPGTINKIHFKTKGSRLINELFAQ